MNSDTLQFVTGVLLVMSGVALIVPFELLRRSFYESGHNTSSQPARCHLGDKTQIQD